MLYEADSPAIAVLFEAQEYVLDVATDAIDFNNIDTREKWDNWCQKFASRIEDDANQVAEASTLLTET